MCSRRVAITRCWDCYLPPGDAPLTPLVSNDTNNEGIPTYIGKPKQPTIIICDLLGDEYQRNLFKNQDILVYQVFPGLKLTANQIFEFSSPI